MPIFPADHVRRFSLKCKAVDSDTIGEDRGHINTVTLCTRRMEQEDGCRIVGQWTVDSGGVERVGVQKSTGYYIRPIRQKPKPQSFDTTPAHCHVPLFSYTFTSLQECGKWHDGCRSRRRRRRRRRRKRLRFSSFDQSFGAITFRF